MEDLICKTQLIDLEISLILHLHSRVLSPSYL